MRHACNQAGVHANGDPGGHRASKMVMAAHDICRSCGLCGCSGELGPLAAVLNGAFVVQGACDASGTDGIGAAQRSGHDADHIGTELCRESRCIACCFQSAFRGGSVLGVDDGEY